MKKLFVGAAVAAICAIPGMPRAENPGAPQQVAAPAQRDAARPDSAGGSPGAEDEASEYAAREKEAAQLEEFAGGADGVYIGTGALVVALLIALLIVAL